MLTEPTTLFKEKILGEKKEFSKEFERKLQDGKEAEEKIATRFVEDNKYNIKEINLNKYKNGADKYTYFLKENPFFKASIDAWMTTVENEDFIFILK